MRRIGLVLKDRLENIVNVKNDGDYRFLNALKDYEYRDLNENSDFSNLDLVFFLHYPYNKELSKQLISYENMVPFINKPSGVLRTSEKTFEYTELKQFTPLTKFLSPETTYEEIFNFANNFETTVIKPVNGTGGKGIYFIDKPYKEEDILKLKEMGKNKNKHVIQEYLDNDGDKRILCYNGVVLGGFGRRSSNSRIHNISNGGVYVDFNPSKKEIEMAEEISNELKSYGVFFAGLDVINDKLIEVNTAMPGGMNTLTPYKLNKKEDVYEVFKQETEKIIASYK